MKTIDELVAEADAEGQIEYHWFHIYFETYADNGLMVHRNTTFTYQKENKLPAWVISDLSNEWLEEHQKGQHPEATNTMAINISYMGKMGIKECLTKP